VLLLGAAPATVHAEPDNLGTEFWLGFPHNAYHELKLFITGPVQTTGTVAAPGLSTPYSAPFTVTPGAVTTVPVPLATQMWPGEQTQSKGIHVTAASEVAVFGLNHVPASTDAYLGLPVDALGTSYTVMAWGAGAGDYSEFSVVASADGTVVTIRPSVTAGAHPAGVPYDVTLNQGQEHQLVTYPSPRDLTGTKITSTAPVAVFAGHRCANVPALTATGCNHVVEQLTPDDTWGTSFVTLGLAKRTKGDTLKLLARDPGTTTVTVNAGPPIALNATNRYRHEMIVAGDAWIESDKPIFVAQFAHGGGYHASPSTGDPFMMMIPPTDQFQPSYTVTTVAPSIGMNFINLVVPNAAVPAIQIDGMPVPGFAPVGTSGFQGARALVLPGSHTVTGNGAPFGAFAYGFSFGDAYGFPGGIALDRSGVAGLDHFECYTALPRQGTTRTAMLRDHFGSRQVHVGDARQLCNPVRKTRGHETTPILHPKAHLVCHATTESAKTPTQAIRLRNQFGTVETRTTGARSLCLPSLKRVVKQRAVAPSGELPQRTLDHFRCYGVQPRQTPRSVTLTDQFGRRSAKVIRLTRFCTTARKTYQHRVTKVRRPEADLACYRIIAAPTFTPRDVIIRSQFGTRRMRVLKVETLCLPTTTQILIPPAYPLPRPSP